MWERVLDSLNSVTRTPSPSPPFNVCSATGAHNHELVGAPDQDAGSSGPPETESLAVGRPLGSIQQGHVEEGQREHAAGRRRQGRHREFVENLGGHGEFEASASSCCFWWCACPELR
jgi:hypothetical protein